MKIRPLEKAYSKNLEDFLVVTASENLRSLAQSYIRASFSDDFRKPKFLTAIENEKIVEAIAYSEELFTIEVWGLSWLAVAENRRNRGIGQELIETAIEHISSQINARATIILATYPGKTKLYDKLGFKQVGEDHAGGFFMTRVIEPL